jgi:flagellar biosynthesis component FlhA
VTPAGSRLDPGFRQFVIRGTSVVASIVFAMVITVQFVVIAGGAQRGYYTTARKRPVIAD